MAAYLAIATVLCVPLGIWGWRLTVRDVKAAIDQSQRYPRLMAWLDVLGRLLLPASGVLLYRRFKNGHWF